MGSQIEGECNPILILVPSNVPILHRPKVKEGLFHMEKIGVI